MMNGRKLMSYKGIFLTFTYFVLLGACGIMSKNDTSPEQCFGSFDEFAYSMEDVSSNNSDPTVLPLWQIEAPVPESSKDNVLDNIRIEIVRGSKEHREIWIRRVQIDGYRNEEGESINDDLREFLVYFPDTGTWTTIPAEIGGTGVWVGQLFVDSSNTVWGRNEWYYARGHNVEKVPVLSKFNQETQRFEFDSNSPIDSIGSDDPGTEWARPLIILDDQNVFWIFVQHDGLYSYNPRSEIVKMHAPLKEREFVRFAAINENDSIYFVKLSEEDAPWLEYGELQSFNPQLGDINLLDLPDESWPAVYSLLVDQNDNLWLDGSGWRSPDGGWNLLHPNLGKYFDEVLVSFAYRWSSPQIILESSNGYLWFRKAILAEEGMAWFDPISQEGCWFASTITNIIEDTDKTLWLVNNGELLKYIIRP